MLRGPAWLPRLPGESDADVKRLIAFRERTSPASGLHSVTLFGTCIRNHLTLTSRQRVMLSGVEASPVRSGECGVVQRAEGPDGTDTCVPSDAAVDPSSA